jgi:glycerol-3-phosphate dehydrogenase (NAD(P)+)
VTIERLAIVGAGAFGTALAQIAGRSGRETLLWARNRDLAETINSTHENPAYLPGQTLHPAIRATSDLADVAHSDCLLLVTPAQAMRSVLEAAPSDRKPLILCSKGIEERSGKLLNEVAEELAPGSPIGVLSGPGFAHEIAAGLPTAVTFASRDAGLYDAFQERLAAPAFRLYFTDDVTGAEVGGAVKNVLAIACGVVEGKRLGQSARAALIARGFAEMSRFATALGARRETLAGLSGLGDLVLTCTSDSSRNYSLGKAIGEGRSAAEMLSDRSSVAEGAFTAPVLARLARDRQIDMPVVAAVDQLISGRSTVDEVLGSLLARPPRPEAH